MLFPTFSSISSIEIARVGLSNVKIGYRSVDHAIEYILMVKKVKYKRKLLTSRSLFTSTNSKIDTRMQGPFKMTNTSDVRFAWFVRNSVQALFDLPENRWRDG